MGFVEQGDQVVVGTVARGDLEIVAHVVARVLEGRVEARVDPQRVAAEVSDVIELGDDAGDVADAVAVRIGEALRVDLIESRVGEPLGAWEGAGHHGSFPSVGVGGVPVVGPVPRRGCRHMRYRRRRGIGYANVYNSVGPILGETCRNGCNYWCNPDGNIRLRTFAIWCILSGSNTSCCPAFPSMPCNRCHPVLTSKRPTCPGGGIRCVAGSDTAVRTRRKE